MQENCYFFFKGHQYRTVAFQNFYKDNNMTPIFVSSFNYFIKKLTHIQRETSNTL